MPRSETIQRDNETVTRHRGTCKGCGQEIWWVRGLRYGRTAWTPENEDGANHFTTCPKATQFHRRTQLEFFKS